MNLQRLRYFETVARLRSFRAAAAELNVSQSALSRQVQVLEREVGATLLVRAKKRVALSPSGAFLLEKARHLLQEMEFARSEAKRLSTPPGRAVTVGVLQSLLIDAFPRALLAWRRTRAAAPLQVFGYRSAQIIEGVQTGAYDFGIVGVASGEAPQLAFEPLFEEAYLVLAARGHELAARERVRPLDLAGRSLLSMPRGYAIREALEAWMGPRFDARRVVAEVESIDALVRLAEAGLGLCVLPASAAGAAREAALVARPLADPPMHRTIQLVRRPERPLGPASRELVDALVAAARAMTGPAPAASGGPRAPARRRG